MATVTNWIDHLNKPAEEVAGAIYPGAGSVEGILVIIALVLWVGWHILTAKAESCLLYTSPSPRDQRGSRMPSSA